MLEETLKYFEDREIRHFIDPDIEGLPNSEQSNRKVICESSEQDLEEFLRLGSVTPRSNQGRANHVIEIDE